MSFAQPFSGYEILERVGSGAMGTVFKARQKHMNRVVALKVLRPALARNARYVDRLRREARIIGALNHPNIVTGYDVGEEGGYHFFVMEFVEGKSLRDLLGEWGMFPEEQVLDVAVRVAEALDHAFKIGVIHRDIKPGNILIDDATGQVKLTDMGLAKGPTDVTLTRDGATVGTPQYISPEQARNPQEVDIRSDLYSLGATLFHMATGAPPFRGDSIGQLITKVLHDRAPSAASLNPVLSDGLNLVIRKLLAKDPGLRYQTPAELLVDLRRVQRDEAPEVDLRRLERAERKGRGRRVPLWAVLAAAPLLAVALWAIWPRNGGAGEAAARADGRFRRELEQGIARAGDYGAKLRLIRAYRDAADDDATRRVLEQEETGVLQQLDVAVRSFLDGYLGERRQATDSWFNDPANWHDGGRFLTEVVPAEFAAEFGFRPELSPDSALRTRIDRRLRDLQRELDAVCAARDRHYRERYDAFLRDELRRAIDGYLERAEFALAARELRDRLASGPEGLPDVLGLPDGLRGQIAAVRLPFEQEQQTRIQKLQSAAAAGLLRELEQGRESLRTRLTEGSSAPDALEREVDRLEHDLERNHPPSTAFGDDFEDPWPTVRQELRGLRRGVEALRPEFDRAVLESALTLAYRVLVEAGPAAAIRVLDVGRELDPSVEGRRARHRQALRAAQDVRATLLDHLLGMEPELELTVPGPNHTAQTIVLTRAADRTVVVTRRAAGVVAVPPFQVNFESLFKDKRISGAVRAGLLADHPAGIAFWMVVQGDPTRAVQQVDDETLEFLRDEVWPLVQSADGAPAEESEAQKTLRSVLMARDIGDHEQAGRLLAVLEARFADSPECLDNRSLREETRSWVRWRQQVERVRRELARATPDGTRIEVDDDLHAAVSYPLDALIEGRNGWRGGPQAIAMAAGELTLEAAIERGLRFACPFADDSRVELEVTVQFPATGQVPQLILVRVLGIDVGVVVLAGRAAVASVLGSGASPRGDALTAKLQKPLTAAAEGKGCWITPGADFRLRIVLEHQRTSTRVEVWLDDHRIEDKDKVPRTGDPSAEVLIAPLQDIVIREVTLRGRRE